MQTDSPSTDKTLRKRHRLVYGVLLPIAIMVAGLLVIMSVDSGAGAAEFAALGIMLGALIVSPVVLIINFVLAFQNADTAEQCFKRGMIAPGIVLIGAVVYQTGLWDAIT